ncbi:MAG: methyltransferase domain-containing protein [Syntrophorhabdales bacterium]|jgi:phosphatidylethanolamine/phosphatidyl-N-methylethanolamine N-methyltransferase
MNQDEVKSIYTRYSSVYDKIFSHFFFPRIRLGLDRSEINGGDRIIEVGVGTGISLSLYPEGCRIVGIDVTRKMLEKAQEKKERHKLDHVELVEMDAENMTFDDDSFDHAVAAFVVTVVPNPQKMVSEMKRVTKSGGNIVILNHFCSKNAFVSKVEKVFSPLCEKWGWRSDISLDLLSNHCDLQIKHVLKKNKYDPWSIIIATNKK